jgi:hypothetical protein
MMIAFLLLQLMAKNAPLLVTNEKKITFQERDL